MDSAPNGGDRRLCVRALVLSPTRELALQIGDSFRTYGRDSNLRFVTIFGGVGQEAQARALRHGADVVVATAGRLIDIMDQGLIDLGRIETFVLDEADRMLDMGFLPSIRRIVRKLPARRQTVLLSATMPPQIVELANSLLRDPARVQIEPVKATAELIDQSVCHVSGHQKPQALARLLDARSVERALVFTRTKRGADRVVKQLFQSGIRAEAIHGNKSQSARQRALANFKSSRTRILIATDIAARGIDVEGISHVFNYDLPHEPETYIHRIGRTGRAGASGCAVSLCDPAEVGLLSAIERLIRKKLVVDSRLPHASPEQSARRPRPKSKKRSQNAPRRSGGPMVAHAARVRHNFGAGESGAGESGAGESNSGRPVVASPAIIEAAPPAGQRMGLATAGKGRVAKAKVSRWKWRSSRRRHQAIGS